MRKLALALLATLLPAIAVADLPEEKILARVTRDYARCSAVLYGNFDSDEEAKIAEKNVFVPAIIANVRKFVAVQSRSKDSMLTELTNIVGTEGAVGFALAMLTLPQLDEEFSKEELDLKKSYNFDWRRANKTLWERHGCAAIYNSLLKKEG